MDGEQERYLSTQHERDQETGLDYRGARYYDSDIARFLSLDPFFANFLSWNPFKYCLSNPVQFIDSDGKKEKPFEKGKSKAVNQIKKTETPVYVYDAMGEILKYHSQAKSAYNCHSFAWHSSKGDSNDGMGTNKKETPLWDNDPTDDITQQQAIQLNSNVRNKVGDKVIYYDDADGNGVWDKGETIAHSAVVNKVDKYGNTVTVKGKMGQGGISVNHPAAPGYYETDDLTSTGNSLSRAYFRVGTNIQTIGNSKIIFDSNMVRKSDSGVWIAQDLNTGKEYGVVRNSETGQWNFNNANEK